MENGDVQKLAEEVQRSESQEEQDILSTSQSKEAEERKKKYEVQFKVSHGLLIGFLTLLTYVIRVFVLAPTQLEVNVLTFDAFSIRALHVFGIYLFTSGFLLTRLVLTNHNECAIPPTSSYNYEAGSVTNGCWHPKTFDRAVVIIIDALRYDFTVPFIPSDNDPSPHYYHNSLQLLHELALSHPAQAVLRPFIADPPTTTLQRLKALTVGTLPTFIEAGTNFAGTAIDEDNLIGQLRTAGKKVVHLGDDTWHSLFPDYFEPNLTRAYDSFNVWDIHTVDNGVTEHLLPILQNDDTSKWDVIIGHFLGVDHVGHMSGPDHPTMTAKLQQMDRLLREVVKLIDDKTLLVVFGDHGMDTQGNHGGESDDEVEAALWMYSKRPVFGRTSPEHVQPPANAKERPLTQIDLVPTLALLLGLPVPFNNLGAPIEEAFIGTAGKDYQNLALVNRLTSAQIYQYSKVYAKARGLDDTITMTPEMLWDQATRGWEGKTSSKAKLTSEEWITIAGAFSSYQRHTLNIYRELWAQFDFLAMALGLTITFATLALLVVYARSFRGDLTSLSATLLSKGVLGLIGGAVVGAGVTVVLPDISMTQAMMFSGAASCCISLATSFWSVRANLVSILPNGLWSWLCILSTLMLSGGFAANSWTIWEDEILLFFLGVFGVFMLAHSFRLTNVPDRTLSCYHSVLFMVMIRLASLSRLCRDEQMPYCKQSFYASASTSTSAPWQLAISYVIALALPEVIKTFYQRSHSYHSSAPFWIGVVLRVTLLLIAIHWTLQAADDGDWLEMDKNTLRKIRRYIAQFVLAIAAGAGTATFAWQAPFVNIETVLTKSLSSQTKPNRQSNSNGSASGNNAEQPKQQIYVRGTTNIYGSHFAVLPLTVLIIPLLLFQKPMGQAALACVAIAIFSLLEILHLLHRQPQSLTRTPTAITSALGPTVLAFLGHLAYFKTGHQAALQSIQWDAAFIPLATIRYPWTPLFMLANTLAGQILAAAAVPAVVLWRRPFPFPSNPQAAAPEDRRRERRRLLSDVARAVATHVLVYATVNAATTVWAAHLRRHLMLYRVFSPRWMLGCVGLVTAEIFAVWVGVGGLRWTVGSVGELFGW